MLEIGADDVRGWVASGKVSSTRRAGSVVLTQQTVQELMANLPPEYPDLKARYASRHQKEERVLRPEPVMRPESVLRSGRLEVTPRRSAPQLSKGGLHPAGALANKRESRKEQRGNDMPRETVASSGSPKRYLVSWENGEDMLYGALPSAKPVAPKKRLQPSAERTSGEFEAVGVEKTLEHMLEPISRTQVRLLQGLSELRQQAPVTGAGQSQVLASIEARLAKIEAKANSAVTGNVLAGGSPLDLKSLQHHFDNALAGLEEKIAAISEKVQSRGNTDGIDADELERLKKRYDKIKEENDQIADELLKAKASLREQKEQAEAALSAQVGALRLELEKDSAQKELQQMREESQASQSQANDEREELRQKLASSETDNENLRQQLESLRGDSSSASKMLSVLDELRSSTDAVDDDEETFARKLVSSYNAKVEAYADLEHKYETCEEENSSLQLLIEGLQRETSSLKRMQAASESEHNEAVKAKGALQNDLEELRSSLESAERERDDALLRLKDRDIPEDEAHLQLEALRLKVQSMGQDVAELQKQNSKLRQEADRVQISYASISQENLSLNQLYGDAQDEAESCKRDLEQARSELKTLRENYETASDNLSKLEELYSTETAATKVQLDELQQRFRKVNMEREALKRSVENAQDEMAQASEAQLKIQGELKKMEKAKAELENLLAEQTTRAEAAEKHVEELEHNASSNSDELEQLTKQFNAVRQSLSESEKRQRRLEQDKISLQGEVSKLNDRVVELECSLNEAKVESTKLKAKVASDAKRIEEMDKQSGTAHDDYQKLLDTIEEMKEDKQKLVSQILAKNTQLAEMERLVSEYDTKQLDTDATASSLNVKIESLEKSLDDARKERAALLAKVAQQEASIVEFTRTGNVSQQRLEEYEAEASDLRAHTSELEQQLALAQEQMAEWRSRVSNAQSDGSQAENLRDEIAALHKQLEEAGAENRRGSMERGELMRQIASLKEFKQHAQAAGSGDAANQELLAKLSAYEEEAAEKDRQLQEASLERANLRDELDNSQRALYEMQQKHERERREWSELLTKQISGKGGHDGDGEDRRGGLMGKFFKNRTSGSNSSRF